MQILADIFRIILSICQIPFEIFIYVHTNILKQNNLSLVICVVISLSLGWLNDHLSPQGEGDASATSNEVILPYSTPGEGFFFFILLFNGFKSFQAKIYEINIYLLHTTVGYNENDSTLAAMESVSMGCYSVPHYVINCGNDVLNICYQGLFRKYYRGSGEVFLGGGDAKLLAFIGRILPIFWWSWCSYITKY